MQPFPASSSIKTNIFYLQCSMLHTIKSPKEISKVVDIDWAGSDRPALVTSTSTLHICDITLKNATSGIENWDLPGRLWFFFCKAEWPDLGSNRSDWPQMGQTRDFFQIKV